MFEIIKFLIETLLKSISITDLVEQKKKKNLNEIGVEFFLLYMALNEIYIVGQYIVEDLENSLSWLEKQNKIGEVDSEYYTKLGSLLPLQSQNITKFINSLHRLSFKLQVIAPEVYVKIVPLMYKKGNLIQKLTMFLSGKRFGGTAEPAIVYFEPDAFDNLITANWDISEINSMSLSETYLYELGDSKKGRELSYHIEGKYHKLEIDKISAFNQSTRKTIQEYLKKTQPRKQLKEIEEALKELRKGIAGNFSLQDILLEVGDKRLSF